MRHLNCVAIKWERRRNQRGLIQCRRCYQWGHGKANCHHKQVCPKCTANHDGNTCNTEIYKCINCGGQHKSTDITCPVYLYKVDKILQRNPTNRRQAQEYRDAPIPQRSAWGNVRPSDTRVIRASGPNETRRQLQPPQLQQTDFTMDENDFPTLTRRTTQRTKEGGAQPQWAAPNESVTNSQDQVSELFNAVNELNQVLNIGELIRFVKDLTRVAKIYTNPIEKSLNTVQFIQTSAQNYKI